MGVPAAAGESAQPPAAPGPLSGEHRRTTLSVVAFIGLVGFESLAVATAMPVAASALGAVASCGLASSSFFTASLLGTVVAGPWGDARGPRAPLAAGASFAALHTREGGQDHLFAGMFAGLFLVAVLAALVGLRGRAPRRREPARPPSATVL